MRPLFAFIIAFLLTSSGPVLAVAQEASPAAAGGMPEGVTLAVLAQGVADQLAPGPVEVGLARISVPPGAHFHIYPDPGVALVMVESGTFTFSMTTEVRVATMEIGGTPVAAGVSASGMEFSLAPGESAVFPAFTEGEARNDGAEPVVAVALFAGPGMGEMATPGAEATAMAEEEMAGITFEPLGYGMSEALPPGPVGMAIVRVTVAPSVTIPPQPHPGPEVGIMEAGSLTFHTAEGPDMMILRGMAAMATPSAEPTVETTGPDQDVTANVGDAFFVPSGSLSGGTAGSDTEAIALFGTLAPLGEAGATPQA